MSYLGPEGVELAFDVGCLGDFQALVAEACTSVLLEHENGSSLAFSRVDSGVFLVWTDPLQFVYSWHGAITDAHDCVQVYLETGWPTSERVRFTHDGT